MSRLGVLKPLRGTESSLNDVILEDGEIAFAFPSTGPGTGAGGIKMGDGENTFGNLDWYLAGGESPDWKYNTGTDEEALLNNIKHPEYETIGKIYYIQAYYHNSTQYTEGTPVVSKNMPYMVIGVNREGTTNTVDLMSLVCADYRTWYNGSYNSWTYGKYSGSAIYSWLSDTCPSGYSTAIQSKMVNMTERWREATGNATGTMMSRQTKCKLLNPVELWGYSSATASWDWEYASTSDYKTDFASPTGTKYGSVYPVWTDSFSALTNRRIFHDKTMSTPSWIWSNSWLAFASSNSHAFCFFVGTDGSCDSYYVSGALGVAPVIRLANVSKEWQYDTGNDEKALLNNIKHPEKETIGKIYYIQGYFHNSSQYTAGTPAIEQNMPYMVIGVNHDGTTNTVDLMSLVAANYIQWNSSYNSWTYGKYTTSGIYRWIRETCPNGYSSAIQSKMCNMTERWREATGNATGTLQTRQTKCKLLNPVELFGYSSATRSWSWEYATTSDYKTDFDTKYGTLYPVWSDSIGALSNRRIFHDKTMSTPSWTWSNSWLAFRSPDSRASCFSVRTDGSCDRHDVDGTLGVAPVIRLSDIPDWSYDTGNDEKALLNNLKHPEHESIGKIYYIQSYMNNGTQYSSGSSIQQGVPYMVIDVNHDGTNGTIDLQCLVAADYIQWNSSYSSWTYGKYTTSGIYRWIRETCPNGYSSAIQSKMCNMTERWREATGNATGTMMSRQTKCKILNPVELFGYSSATFSRNWEYASTSDYKTDFASPTGTKYGSVYPVWTDSIAALTNRRIFHDKTMSIPSYTWSNSWLAFNSSSSYANYFGVYTDGSCDNYNVNNARGVAPVIRLSNSK